MWRFIRSSPRTFISTPAGTGSGTSRRDAYTLRCNHAAVPPRYQTRPSTIIEWDTDGHNGGASPSATMAMLYVTSGDGTPTPTPTSSARTSITIWQSAADRRRSSGPGQDTPCRRTIHSLARRMRGRRRGRMACAIRGGSRSTSRPDSLGRAERPGPVGAGLSGREGVQITAGVWWRAAIRSTRIASRARHRFAKPTVEHPIPSLARSPAASCTTARSCRNCGALSLRRLLDREGLGRQTTAACVRTRKSPTPAWRSPASASTPTANC